MNNQRGTSVPKSKRREQTSVKVTGLFKSKKQGLYVGSIKADDEYGQLDGLVAKIKEARSEKAGLVFFLWKNTYEDGPYFNLFADVSREEDKPRRGSKAPRRKIEEDDDDDTTEESVDLD